MATPTMRMQLDPLSSSGAEAFVSLVASTTGTGVGIATASGITVAGERQATAGRARTVAVTTANTSTTVTGVLRSKDIGKPITGTGIPANTFVVSVGDSSFVISNAATATGAVTATVDVDGLLTFPRLNPNSGSSDDVIDDPEGTVWALVVKPPNAPTPETVYFTVPDTAGYFLIAGEYLTSRPGGLPAPGNTLTSMTGDVGGTVGANTINSGAVTEAKIAADAVTSAKIATGAVGSTELAAGAATTAKIADEAVTRAKRADDLDARDRARQHTSENLSWNGALATVQVGGLFTGRALVIVGDSHVALRSFEGVNRGLAAAFNSSLNLSRLYPVFDQSGLGSWTGDGTEVLGRGMTGRACAMTNGHVRSLAFTGDAVAFFWLVSAGSTEIRVDGNLVNTASGAAAGSYLWTGTMGAHTLEITSVGTTLVDSAYVYASNVLLGISTWEIGHSGYTTQDLLDLPDLIPALALIAPHGVVLATCTNDFGAGAAAYGTRMRELIDDVRAGLTATNPTIFLWIAPETEGHDPWEPMVAEAEVIAREKGVVLINAFETMGSSVDDDGNPYDPNGLWIGGDDYVHFSARGAALNSNLTLGVLLQQKNVMQPTDRVLTGINVGSLTVPANRARLDAANIGGLMTRSVTVDGSAFVPHGVATPLLGTHAANMTYVDAGDTAIAAASIAKTLVDAKGDLVVATAADTPARLAVGGDGTVPVADSGAASGIAWGHSPFVRAAYFLPTGALAETIDRTETMANASLLSSGRLHLVAIVLRAGQSIANISFLSATTAGSSLTNQWFGLWDANRNQLRLTADDTSTAWAANTVKTLALTSAYVVPTTGLYYLSIMVAASTPPTFFCATHSAATALQIAPRLSGTAQTGLTNPASAPATASALGNSGNIPYAYVS